MRPIISKMAAIVCVSLASMNSLGQTRPAKPPVVDSGTLMNDFLRNYGDAADIYDTEIFALQGRIGGVTMGKTPDGKSLAKVKLLPRDPCKEVLPVIVNLGGTAADAAAKLKTGELAEIGGVTYTAVPQPPIIHEITLLTGDSVAALGPDKAAATRHDEAVAWLNKNSALGPTSPFVQDMTGLIEKHLAAGEDFTMLFGPALMQSKQPTQLGMVNGKLFSLPLTDAQAKQKKIEGGSVSDAKYPVADQRGAAEVTFDPPVFEGKGKWDATKPLAGKVKLTAANRPRAIEGDYALRMTSLLGGRRIAIYSYGTRYATEYPVTFKMPDENQKAVKSGEDAGPRIVIFQVVRMTKRKNDVPFEEVISDAQTMVLDVTVP